VKLFIGKYKTTFFFFIYNNNLMKILDYKPIISSPEFADGTCLSLNFKV
jgi:hypothetical protein